MKQGYFLIVTLLSLLVSGCGKEPPPMEKQQIVNILMDVHVAEALINGYHAVGLKDSLEERYLGQVLDKWNATTEEFEGVMKYMHGDPDYMRDIYESVQDKVNKYADEIDKEKALQNGRNKKPKGPKAKADKLKKPKG